MAQFHDIFCLRDELLPRSELETLVWEAWQGEGDPAIAPAQDGEAWQWLQLRLPGVASPLTFVRDLDQGDITAHVNEAIEEAATPLPPAVTNHLQQVRQSIGIELKPDRLTDDAWELLDNVQSHLATHLDGILLACGEYFDNQLQRIA